MALLEATDIHTYYGAIHALKGITITVDTGEIVTLIGANGAGKTTTLNTICGILHPRQGTIVLGWRANPRIECPHNRHPRSVAVTGRAARLWPPVGRRKPGDGRVYPQGQGWHQARPGAGLRAVPAAQGAPQAAGRHAVGRRAADAGHGPRLDGQPAPAAAGRAVHGPGADPGRSDLRHHQGDQLRRASPCCWWNRTR